MWTRRSRVLAGAAVLVGCTGLTWFLLAAGSRGAEVAGVLSLAATLVLAAAAWLARSHDLGEEALAAAARQLAGLVRREWAGTLQRLLAGGGAPGPADVGYVRGGQAGPAGGGLVRWRSDGGAAAGSLADVAAYYAGLRLGRLVVLGAPGSGKTVLAIHLLLERLDAVAAAGPAAGRARVPVLLSLPAWPAPGAGAGDRELSAAFDGWVARHLVQTYRLAEPVAAALVAGGWVLPVLDGLDEMDAEAEAGADAGAEGLRPRARLAVRALNQDPGTGLRPVVLTCREHRYRQLVAAGGDPEAPPVLEDATAVTVQPLTPAQVAGYLAYRFPGAGGAAGDGGPAGLDARWQPVADALAADPAGALAAALGTPWRLFLAVTGYHAADTRPADLADLARTRPGDLDDHLLDRLVPAATRLHRRPGGTRYQPAAATRGLATLARHLAGQQGAGGSGTDIEVNELWRAAGPRAPRYLHAALAATPLLCLFVPFVLGLTGDLRTLLTDPLSAPRDALIPLACFLGALFLVCSSAAERGSRVRRADYRRLRKLGAAEMRTLAFGLAFWLAVGLAYGLAFGLAYGLAFGLAVGLALGLAAGLAAGLAGIVQESPRAIDRPSALLRQDMAFHLVTSVLALGLAGGLGLGLAGGLAAGLAVGFAGGLVVGLALGLAGAVWPRFAVAGAILARRGAVPGSLREFLDWAYAAGLLRLSGTSLQFRHIEFQRWAERQP